MGAGLWNLHCEFPLLSSCLWGAFGRRVQRCLMFRPHRDLWDTRGRGGSGGRDGAVGRDGGDSRGWGGCGRDWNEAQEQLQDAFVGSH